MPPPSAAHPPRFETWFSRLFFAGALALALWGLTRGWSNGNLPGHEFRQAQTAISALFIQRDRDFSPAYPTPLLGPPWSLPLEFPLYQWTVVVLSNATGWPLLPCARLVSAACLLAVLPAAWLLLRRAGAPPARRWLVLGVALLCPVLVFYGRAFLIETMALAGSVWFLAAAVEAMHERRWRWTLVAALAGTAGALVKVTTWAVWLLPAAVWGAWLVLHRARTGAAGPRAALATAWHGLAAALPPLAAAAGWVRFSDAIKAAHPDGAFLTSSGLTDFNLGLGAFAARWSAGTWLQLADTWQHRVLSAPALALVLVAGIAAGGRWRRPVVAAVGVFLAAQFAFPHLYRLHDYYFVAAAPALLLAAGLAVGRLFELPGGRWLGAAGALLVAGLQVREYRDHYAAAQAQVSYGGTGLTLALRDLVAPDETLVVIGADWDASIPFHAGRRALLVRRRREHDAAFLAGAFDRMASTSVGALVLIGDPAGREAALQLAAERLGIDPRPVFLHRDARVYLHRLVLADLGAEARRTTYDQVEWQPEFPVDVGAELREREVEPARLHARWQRLFANLQPLPVRMFARFGARQVGTPDGPAFDAHAGTWLRFAVAAGPREVRLRCRLPDDVFARPEYRSDGVTLVLRARTADGAGTALWSRHFHPRANPADRGLLELRIPVQLPAGAELELATEPGPAGDYSFDWFHLLGVTVE